MGREGDYYLNKIADNDGQFNTEKWATTNSSTADQVPDIKISDSVNSGAYIESGASLPSFVGRHYKGLTSDTNAAGRVINWGYYEDNGYSDSEILAANQKNRERLGNGLITNLTTLGSTLASGTAGLIYGIFDSLFNWDISKLADNAVTRGVNNWNEEMMKDNPIYTRKGYQDLSALERLGTTEFWAQQIQNAGFTEGAVISALIPGAILAKAPAFVATVASALYSSIGEGTIEALNAKKDKINLETAIATEEYNKKRNDIKNLPSNMRAEAYADLDNEFNKTLANINEDGDKVGNSVLGLNIAILTFTGLAEFTPFIKRGMAKSRARVAEKMIAKGDREGAARLLEKNVTTDKFTKITKDATGVITDASVRKSGLVYAGEAAKVVGRGASEAFEEIAQNIATSASDKYERFNSFNDSEFNPEKRELANNLLNSIWKSTLEAMHDQDALTEGLAGAITGIIGAPMIRGIKNNNGKFQSPVYMQGALHEVKENIKEYKSKKNSVDILNKRLQDPKFREFYNRLPMSIDFNERINNAIAENDIKSMKDNELKKIISDLMLFKNIGALEQYKKMLDDISNYSDEQINDLIESTSDENGNGPFSSTGNKDSVESVREKIKNNVDYIKKQVDLYDRYSTIVESTLPSLDQKIKENLIAAHMQEIDWVDRSEEIKDSIYDIYKKYQEKTDLDKLISKDDFFGRGADEINKDVQNILKSNLSTIDKTYLKNYVDDLNAINTNIENYRKQIADIYTDPSKYVKQRENKKKEAQKKAEENSKKTNMERVDNATSFSELAEIEYGNIGEDEEVPDISKSKNPIAKDYIKAYSILNTLNRKLSNTVFKDANIDAQVKKDIKTILSKASDFKNPNQSIKSLEQLEKMQDDFFNFELLRGENTNENEDNLKKRFDAAMSYITPLMGEINNTNNTPQFVDNDGNSLSITDGSYIAKPGEAELAEQINDDDSNNTEDDVPDVDFDENSNNEDDTNDINDAVLASDDIGQAPSVKPKKGKEKSGKEKKSGETSITPEGVTVYTNDVGETHTVLEGTTPPVGEASDTELQKEGFDSISEDNSDIGTFYPSIYQYDLTPANPIMDKEKGVYKDIKFVKPVYEGSDRVYKYLEEKGPEGNVFEWVNNGGLSKYAANGGKVYIGIDPEFSETQPIFFVKINDEYKPINLSYVSKEQIEKRGLTGIHEKVLSEYSKNPGKLYISPYLFKVHAINKERIPFTVDKKYSLNKLTNGLPANSHISIVVRNAHPKSGHNALILERPNGDVMVPLGTIKYKERASADENSTYMQNVNNMVDGVVSAVQDILNGSGHYSDITNAIYPLKRYMLLQDLDFFFSEKNNTLYFSKLIKDKEGNVVINEKGYPASNIILGITKDSNIRNSIDSVLGNFNFVINKDFTTKEQNDLINSGVVYCFTPSLTPQMAFYNLERFGTSQGSDATGSKVIENSGTKEEITEESATKTQKKRRSLGAMERGKSSMPRVSTRTDNSLISDTNINETKSAPQNNDSYIITDKEAEYIEKCEFL